MMKRTLVLTLPLLLAACATTPLQPLPPDHPASTQAPESRVQGSSTALKQDEATRETTKLLSGAAEPKADNMSTMPGMNH